MRVTHALSAQPRGESPSWAFAFSRLKDDYRFLVDFRERERGDGGTLPPF
jgi:hypothetical protein